MALGQGITLFAFFRFFHTNAKMSTRHTRTHRERPHLDVSEGVKCGPGIREYNFCVFLFFSRKRENVYLCVVAPVSGAVDWSVSKGFLVASPAFRLA